MRPDRWVEDQPCFTIDDVEYIFTVHSLRRCKEMGFTMSAILAALSDPDDVRFPTEKSTYYGTSTVRFVRDRLALVVEHTSPVHRIVVTALFKKARHWDEWFSTCPETDREYRGLDHLSA